MTKEELRIVFMGTPEFAVASLKALVEANYNVVGVVTMPDKPAGRGYRLQQSAVKEYALNMECCNRIDRIPILQPERLKDEEFLDQLHSLKADLQIVVAFRMLPEVVWNMPRCGTFNLHASLLPDYRGAAPINWAVMNGDTHTGVSTFFLTHEIDTGDVILQQRVEIEQDDNVGLVYHKLMHTGASLLTQTVDLIIQGKAHTVQQHNMQTALQRPAPKIYKETCHMDFSRTTQELHNQVRGLSPHPAAWLTLTSALQPSFDTTMKVFSTKPLYPNAPIPSGKVITEGRRLLISTADGILELLEVQLAGKRKMTSTELLNGVQFPPDTKAE